VKMDNRKTLPLTAVNTILRANLRAKESVLLLLKEKLPGLLFLIVCRYSLFLHVHMYLLNINL
jgi:hypothetical protein